MKNITVQEKSPLFTNPVLDPDSAEHATESSVRLLEGQPPELEIILELMKSPEGMNRLKQAGCGLINCGSRLSRGFQLYPGGKCPPYK